MTIPSVQPVDEELHFDQDEIIVSKTDLKGILTYTNDVFCRVAEMSTREVIGQPHNIIRHPDMPRTIFKLLWDSIKAGKEIFAYVKNMSKTGKYYWVIAHVTPSYDGEGNVSGYHSNRRYPPKEGLEVIKDLYKSILLEENKHTNRKKSVEAGSTVLQKILEEQGLNYSEFIWKLGK